ncbi:hypothetical protein X975_00292, partial [Stegodyphus mimosarum]
MSIIRTSKPQTFFCMLYACAFDFFPFIIKHVEIFENSRDCNLVFFPPPKVCSSRCSFGKCIVSVYCRQLV